MANTNRHWEQDKDCTLYIGNIAEECKDEIIYELMLQCAPIVSLHLPKDRVSQQHQGYGFVEFPSEVDATYACNIMNGIRLYGKPIRLNKVNVEKRTVGENGVPTTTPLSIGAEIFVGGLDTMVDERVLYDTFSRFGPLLAPPKITRDENGLSKGYGYISYASFEAGDSAVENMHGQYLGGKEVKVEYALKKDRKGEKHGDEAERTLAARAIKNSVQVAIPAMPAALVMPQQTVPVMPQVPNGYGAMGAAQQPPMYNYGKWEYSQTNSPQNWFDKGTAPPPFQTNYAAHPPRQYNQAPLQAPGASAGLPPRPPPSQGGYGGPPGRTGYQPNMQMPPPGFPPGFPPGYGQQPPGMPPYQQAPPGSYRP